MAHVEAETIEIASPALERMRADVARLSAIDRRTARPGEAEAAAYIARELRDAGAREVETLSFRTQDTWAWVHGAHTVAGLVAAALGGRTGRLLSLATLASYEADASGRSQWSRRLMPAGTGTTVEARVPSRGRSRRTLVIVAHHDAAHMGWVWHPVMVDANRRRSAATGKGFPSHLLPSAAMAAAATGVRPLRAAAGALLTVGLVLYAQSARSATTPGANDNATGVAAALELARRFARDPLEDTELVFVFPGGEEVGAVGMAAWMRDRGSSLDRATTFVVGLDSLGSHGQLTTTRRDAFTGWFREADLDVLDRAADQAGVEHPQRVTFPNVTDAIVARHAGLRACTLTSYRDGWIENLHRPTDVPSNVDWDTVARALRLLGELPDAWRAAAGARDA